MKKLLPIFLSFVLFTLSACGDYEKGVDAYKDGNYATALSVFQPLAENKGVLSLFYSKEDVINAQSRLGWMYENGEGVSEDDEEAVKWYTLAAEQGHARAQSNLGGMYGNGQGVLQDYVRAHMWYNIAASSGGSKYALQNRDIVAKRMSSSQIETVKKLARECVRKKYKGC